MADSTTPPTLSFPREIFAALSPSPFLLAHLAPTTPNAPPTRPNGRSPSTFRTPTINASSLTHCSGSAVVRLGDTAVVCGVRGEILLASDIPNPHPPTTSPSDDDTADDSAELPSLNLLVPNLELSTGCSPAHLPGNPPSTLAQSLSQRILSLLHETRLIRAQDLRILYEPPPTPDDDEMPDVPPRVETKAYWTLYIDVLFISLDGNAFDAAWGAVLAALRDTVLPRAWWEPDLEMVLCSDVAAEAGRLRLRGLPVAATFAVFSPEEGKARARGEGKAWLLSDPDTLEEDLCGEQVCVVVDAESADGGRIRKIEKSGGGVISRGSMREVVGRAEERWREWHSALVEAQA